MTKRRKARIERVGELRSAGWQLDYASDLNKFHFHNGYETPKHALVKLLLCKRIKDAGHAFATEISHPERGSVDVLDIHESGPAAYVYEVETDANAERRREKARLYTDGFTAAEITDVFVIDPLEAPDLPAECETWLEDEVVGGE